jgi:hypothetical protein
MRGASQFVKARRGKAALRNSGAVLALAIAIALPLVGQVPGAPPSTNQVRGHFLAPPPSVTSIGGHHLPPPLPSVTSIPNFNSGNHFHNGNGAHFNHGGFRGGFSYGFPYYYYPLDDPGAYGYDYMAGGGGPDLYSGPPLGPDQNPHIVVEQPPARPYNGYNGMYDPSDRQAYAAPPSAPPPAPDPPADAKPGEPSVLIFRDGHQQEVTNYAIMGDSVYVFDKAHKKIALADLDVPATVKANDDRGLEFKVPASPAQRKNLTVPQSTVPDESTTAPSKVAAAMP